MKILVVSAHPDDETLGVGGTLLKHLKNGDDVIWLIMTTPSSSDWSETIIEQCNNQVKLVAKAYEFTEVIEVGLPAARLDQIAQCEIIDKVLAVIRDVQPERIYTVGNTDVHTDHIITFNSVMSAAKPFRTDLKVNDIFAYEVLSSTEGAYGWRPNSFIPNVYSDISEFMKKKLEIMEIYENQIQSKLLPRSSDSIKALARYRGATIGVQYCETFHLIRSMLKV